MEPQLSTRPIQSHNATSQNATEQTSTTDNQSIHDCDDNDHHQNGIKFEDWGFKVDRLFEVAYRFYKRNESKAFHPTFDIRNQMNALMLQARYGNFDGIKAPDVGALDLIGKSRRHQWSLLKGMSKTEAMSKFVYTLDEICPFFKAHAEAVKISSNLASQNINRSEQVGKVSTNLATDNTSADCLSVGNDLNGDPDMDDQLNTIRTSLNRQTYEQFKSYAQKQFPNDKAKRKNLIATLQEQYYQQYISQMQVISPNQTSSEMNIQDNQVIDTSETNGSNSMQFTLSSSKVAHLDTIPQIWSTSKSDISSENEISELKSETEFIKPKPQADVSVNYRLQSSNQRNSNKYESSLSNGLSSLKIGDNPNGELANDSLSSQLQPFENYQQFSVQYSNNKSQVPSNQETKLPQNLEITQQTTSIEDNKRNILQQAITKNSNSDNLAQQHKSQYQYDIEPQNIGLFESYPEPTPLLTSQNTTPFSIAINMFGSAPGAITSAQPALSQPSRKVAEENTNKQSEQKFFEPEIFNGTKEVVPLAQLPIPFQPLPPPPPPPPLEESIQQEVIQSLNVFQEPPSVELHNVIISNPLTSHTEAPPLMSPNQILNEMRTVDTWSCGGSSGQASPTRQTNLTYGPLESASIWTKKGVMEFRESLIDDKNGGIQVVNQGTLLTIQVPTYYDGRFIHFEFCTEDYDIAFGLDFVYEMYLEEPLAVRIYEESDTEDEDDCDEAEQSAYDGEINHFDYTNDAELAMAAAHRKVQQMNQRKALAEKRRAAKAEKAANTVAIVPTYRRDSHQEVYIGRHRYPGQGYYLLKFDNTYSVLRSKTLFFRICYLM